MPVSGAAGEGLGRRQERHGVEDGISSLGAGERVEWVHFRLRCFCGRAVRQETRDCFWLEGTGRLSGFLGAAVFFFRLVDRATGGA